MARPSKYKKEYCQMIIDYMSEGFSLAAFAGKIEVNQDTMHEWAKKHPEFSEAKRIAIGKSLQWWEKQGVDGLWDITILYDKEGKKVKATKKLNATVWIFNMKNRHGWRDQVTVEHEDVIKRFIIDMDDDQG